MAVKRKFKYVLFWLKSSRGTDAKQVRKYLPSVTKATLDDHAETWAKDVIAGTAVGYCRYGWKIVSVKPRNELLKEWNRVCDMFQKIKERMDILREKLNTYDWTKRSDG